MKRTVFRQFASSSQICKCRTLPNIIPKLKPLLAYTQTPRASGRHMYHFQSKTWHGHLKSDKAYHAAGTGMEYF
jgi:hypothetical protein